MKNYILLLLLATGTTVYAQKSQVFITDGKAIRGYDPVAFFTDQKPVLGLDKYTTVWNNATWYFSNKQNLDSFSVSPEKYAPQYGGYCAFGAADGHKAPTQTDTWAVINDKLYFNYNQKVKVAWTKDRDRYIEVANSKWNDIKDKE